jgi:hypothetical protein
MHCIHVEYVSIGCRLFRVDALLSNGLGGKKRLGSADILRRRWITYGCERNTDPHGSGREAAANMIYAGNDRYL